MRKRFALSALTTTLRGGLPAAAEEEGSLGPWEITTLITTCAVLAALSAMLLFMQVRQFREKRLMRQLIGNQQNFDICTGNVKTGKCESMGGYPFVGRWGLSLEGKFGSIAALSAICGYDVTDELRSDLETMKRTGDAFITHDNRRQVEGRHFFCRRYVHRLGKNRFICCLLDVTEESRQLEIMTHMASIDYLSSLMNRRSMNHILEKRHEILQDQEGRAFLVMIDIDDFKKINDRYGHDVGDQVLVAVADMIQLVEGAKGRTARWGGEEFLLLLDADSVDETAAKVQEILEYVRQHVMAIQGTEKRFHVTVSAGVAELSRNEPYDASIKRADMALYRAKQEGKNCFRMSC